MLCFLSSIRFLRCAHDAFGDGEDQALGGSVGELRLGISHDVIDASPEVFWDDGLHRRSAKLCPAGSVNCSQPLVSFSRQRKEYMCAAIRQSR